MQVRVFLVTFAIVLAYWSDM